MKKTTFLSSLFVFLFDFFITYFAPPQAFAIVSNSISETTLLQATQMNIQSDKPVVWQTTMPFSQLDQNEFLLQNVTKLPVLTGPQRMLLIPNQTDQDANQTAIFQGNNQVLTELLNYNAISSALLVLANISDKTILIDNETQTITNKTISGENNSFINIPNSSLVHSALKLVAGTGISLSTDTLNLGDTLTISNTLATASGITSLNNLTGALTIAGNGIASLSESNGILTLTATEADTLSAVTGRGATTATALTLSNTANNITAGTITATGGTINGVTIGATNPTTGIFSLVNNLTITNNGSNTLNIAAGKTLTTNKSLIFEGTDGTTMTFPNSSDTIVGLVTSQTLTNKTLAAGSNTISGLATSNFTNANISQWTNDTGFITAATVDTLTNKTLTSPTINGIISTTGLTLPAFIATGNIDQSGSASTFSTGTGLVAINGAATVSANKTFSVTSADSLLVGGNIIPQTVTIAVPLLATLIDQNVFVADNTYQLTAVRCVYSVAALLSGTLQVTVETGTNAPGSGTNQLSSAINLSTTINTVYSGTIVGSPTTIVAGNKVSLDVGGTLTGLLGSCTLTLKRI